jgi:hypothetical protein
MTKGRINLMLSVAGVPVIFTSLEALEVQATSLVEAIRKIEAGPIASNPRDIKAWNDIERHADDLAQILQAIEALLAEEDRLIAQEIEVARKLICEI